MPANITNEIFNILNAVFGETVITSICGGIRKVSDKLVEIKSMEVDS